MGERAEKRVMTFEVCKEMTRRGVAGKGSRSEGCRGAEHGQTCTSRGLDKDRTGVVAAALGIGRAARARRPSSQASRNGQPYKK
jgi:hypothetical protein